MEKRGKVPFRLPFRRRNVQKCPLWCASREQNMIKCPQGCTSREHDMLKCPTGYSSCGENVIRCPLGYKCITPFCMLVPNHIQLVLFLFFGLCGSNILSPPKELNKEGRFVMSLNLALVPDCGDSCIEDHWMMHEETQ